jgi:o-succinylbenzoate synthase
LKIERMILHHIDMPLVTPFETSFGRDITRPCILVELHAEGLVGWGECVAGEGPWYTYETIGTAWHVISDFLAPLMLGQDLDGPEDLVRRFAPVRGHEMARAACEAALWDLQAQARGTSLAAQIGGVRDRVPVGVSVGIERSVAAVVERVASYVADGYARVKLKIKPGFDLALVRAVRERWPDLPLQVDANSAYTLADAAIFREMDAFGLLLIEQPFHHEDIVDHAQLQAQIDTPVCLDESIHSPEHARWALDIEACKVINIKVGRVGGLTAARQIHDLCAQHGVPVWCGGMLETNIGRAANLALAALPNFTLPGDISASARYYAQDIAAPDFVLNSDSTISVPVAVGCGVAIDQGRLAAVRLRHAEIKNRQ